MQQNQPRASHPTASMTHLLLGPLNNLNSVAQQLFQSLSPPHTKPPQPPPIAALANADTALAAAVQLAHLHQKKQQRIEALKAEVLSLESSWRTDIMQLEEGRRDLDAIISEGDVRLDAIEQAKEGTGFVWSTCSWLTTGQVPFHTPSSLHTHKVSARLLLHHPTCPICLCLAIPLHLSSSRPFQMRRKCAEDTSIRRNH
jgi:hypothetical protein